MNKKPALGKGLASLLPARQSPQTESDRPSFGPIPELPIHEIEANPNQPRREFREQQLEELAASIRQEGILQPLLVRREGSRYQLIAGERRLRAAKLAGLSRVPVVIQQIPDERLLEVALIENVQREDLNPIELAQAFERLSSELGLNHEEIGRRTGKDRATVTNSIRLLQLTPDLQAFVAEGKLSPGHARALLKLKTEEQQRKLATQAMAEGWTVRTTETATTRPGGNSNKEIDPNLKSATDELERALGTKVRISSSKTGHGKIEIEYYDLDDLNRIYFYITRQD